MYNSIISRSRHFLRLSIAGALLISLLPATVHAETAVTHQVGQTIYTNVHTDGADANVGDGICDADLATADVQCTLRAAIQEANATAAADTIYAYGRGDLLTLVGSAEDNALTGDLDITHDLTISGEPGLTTVDGGGLDRIFSVLGGAKVTLAMLTIRNGSAANGGGVWVDAGSMLTLDRVTVRDSTAGSGNGGGLYNAKGTIILSNSMVIDNQAADGAGIYNQGSLVLLASTVAGNRGSRGGAIFNDSSSASALVNSTLSGNRATNGGGLYVQSGGVTLNNATVTANLATSGQGGGIFGSVSMGNSIVAGNTGATPDCVGAISSLGYNVIGAASCAGVTNGLLGDQAGTPAAPLDPRLSPLQDNGNLIWTHALLPGSPAVDKGNPAVPNGAGGACAATDQRGMARPGGARCDAGAFEEISTFTVSTQSDLMETLPGDGVCDVKMFGSSAGCTLRAAIQEANLMPGTQVVDLPAGVYTLSRVGADEGESRTGDLDIKDAIILRGAGAGATRIQGAATLADRLIEVKNTVLIQGVELTGGRLTKGQGGALRSSGPLTLRDVVLIDNKIGLAADADGGALYVYGRAVTIENSTLANNEATFGGAVAVNSAVLTIKNSSMMGNLARTMGGAIYSGNTAVTISDSTLISNTAASSSGGAIDIASETLVIRNSTLAGNAAGDRGGAIHATATALTMVASTVSGNQGYMGGGIYTEYDVPVALTNVTISGNLAEDGGGGLVNASSMVLNNVTISQNTAESKIGDYSGGGGLINWGTLVLHNSIVAANLDVAGQSPDCQGTITTQGYNLVQKPAGCSFAPGTGDRAGEDAVLGPLQDNGGGSLSHALLAGSPAIDAGDPGNGSCPATDQRGSGRTDGNGDGIVRCDIGAYEAPAGAGPGAGDTEEAKLAVYLPAVSKGN